MGCILSTESMPTVEIKQKKRGLKERMANFFRRKTNKVDVRVPANCRSTSVLDIESSVTDTGTYYESDTGTNRSDTSTCISDTSTYVSDTGTYVIAGTYREDTPVQEDDTERLDSIVPSRTYSNVSISQMIGLFEQTRAKKTISNTTFIVGRDEAMSIYSSSTVSLRESRVDLTSDSEFYK